LLDTTRLLVSAYGATVKAIAKRDMLADVICDRLLDIVNLL
jgi:hypothetical protein